MDAELFGLRHEVVGPAAAGQGQRVAVGLGQPHFGDAAEPQDFHLARLQRVLGRRVPDVAQGHDDVAQEQREAHLQRPVGVPLVVVGHEREAHHQVGEGLPGDRREEHQVLRAFDEALRAGRQLGQAVRLAHVHLVEGLQAAHHGVPGLPAADARPGHRLGDVRPLRHALAAQHQRRRDGPDEQRVRGRQLVHGVGRTAVEDDEVVLAVAGRGEVVLGVGAGQRARRQVGGVGQLLGRLAVEEVPQRAVVRADDQDAGLADDAEDHPGRVVEREGVLVAVEPEPQDDVGVLRQVGQREGQVGPLAPRPQGGAALVPAAVVVVVAGGEPGAAFEHFEPRPHVGVRRPVVPHGRAGDDLGRVLGVPLGVEPQDADVVRRALLVRGRRDVVRQVQVGQRELGHRRELAVRIEVNVGL